MTNKQLPPLPSQKFHHKTTRQRTTTKDTSSANFSSASPTSGKMTMTRNSNNFRQKVQSANQNAICSASTDVGPLTMGELLGRGTYRVPIFQRRYCWTQTQWATFLGDATQGGKHSLGRLTCTNNQQQQQQNQGEDRSIVLDGQQRLTTTTILLAAIRDRLMDLNSTDPNIDVIQKLLFTDLSMLRQWLNEEDSSTNHTSESSQILLVSSSNPFLLEEGMELEFARLLPTFCDRVSYFAAILPPLSTKKNMVENVTSFHRPVQARSYFDHMLRTSVHFDSLDKVTKLLKTVLNGFHMLYFPIDIGVGRQDGTEDLNVIYERLALRDATFCRPHRAEEFSAMDGADMVRNLLLGSFDTPQDTIRFYKDFWLPIERRTVMASDTTGDSSSMKVKEITIASLLKVFLENEAGSPIRAKQNYFGGQLFADFEAWMSNDAQQRLQQEAEYDPQSHAKDIATRISALLGQLLSK